MHFPLYVYYNQYILIPVMALNSSTETENTASSCYGIPSHQHIQIWSRNAGMINGVPQSDIVALHIRCVSAYHSMRRTDSGHAHRSDSRILCCYF